MDPKHEIVEHLPRLRRYAVALTRDSDVADDLVQSCLERALTKLHLFQAGSDMRAWMFTIMHNLHINILRKGARTGVTVPLEDTDNLPSAPPAQDGRLALRDLNEALGRLAEEKREVVLLIGLEGMSYKETAEILGVPVGTVMSRLARGREELRKMMDERGEPTLRRVK